MMCFNRNTNILTVGGGCVTFFNQTLFINIHISELCILVLENLMASPRKNVRKAGLSQVLMESSDYRYSFWVKYLFIIAEGIENNNSHLRSMSTFDNWTCIAEMGLCLPFPSVPFPFLYFLSFLFSFSTPLFSSSSLSFLSHLFSSLLFPPLPFLSLLFPSPLIPFSSFPFPSLFSPSLPIPYYPSLLVPFFLSIPFLFPFSLLHFSLLPPFLILFFWVWGEACLEVLRAYARLYTQE